MSRGDLIQAGAQVTFSLIGTVDPLVQSYVVCLACTNGMTSNTVIREFHFSGGGEGDNIWQWFRRSVRAACGSLDRIVVRYRQMMNLITRANSHLIELPQRVRQAQLAVAKYTYEKTHARLCPVCHTRRN